MSRIILLAALFILLAACQPAERMHSHKFLAFGTIVEVKIYSADEKRVRQAFTAVEEEFRYMDRTWTPWKPSALMRVNNLLRTTEWFSVAPSVRPLIVKSSRLARQSDNLFNPAIGKLVELWSFNDASKLRTTPPAREAILKLVRRNPVMADLELKGILIRSRNPAVMMDFGAFAKGYGIGAAIRTLRRFGFDNALVAAGGDIQVIGRPGKRDWRIAVKHPRERGFIASVDLKPGESIFTSGDYERYFMVGKTRYHHILDPRTGYPARGVISVTVIHNDPATADAAATALFVAGPKDWHRIARRMGIRYVMLIDDRGRIHMNPAMAKRMRLRKNLRATIITSKPL